MFPRGENVAAVYYLRPRRKVFCAASLLEQLRRFAAAVMVAAGVIMVI
jgi:hypothetical protein